MTMNKVLTELFQRTLYLSAQLRPEYPDSLGQAGTAVASRISDFWSDEIPDLVVAIYSHVSGTKANLKDQSLLDYIPGYRLVHIDELQTAYKALYGLARYGSYFPLLANYSSDFICISNNRVYGFSHDEQTPYLMHSSEQLFLQTVCEFYSRQVYFTDEDGYLDYDPEEEGLVGSAINPGVLYWT